jgi:hypothetical protein
VPEHHHAYTTFVLWLPLVHLPVALADHIREISVVVACKPMWQNTRAYQIITDNLCPHINAELLLVLRGWYRLCRNVPHLWRELMKQRNARLFVNKHRPKFPRPGKSAITHKLNSSRHMLIWTIFLVLVCETRAQSFSALFTCILLLPYVYYEMDI